MPSTNPRRTSLGTVYLIHFETKLHHAQHYLGYALDVDARIAYHRASLRRTRRAAKLIVAVNKKGIEWRVVRTWTGTRTLERQLKNRKKSRTLCPLCCGDTTITRIPPWCIPHPCNEPMTDELPY